jgi:hypothetical protein
MEPAHRQVLYVVVLTLRFDVSGNFLSELVYGIHCFLVSEMNSDRAGARLFGIDAIRSLGRQVMTTVDSKPRCVKHNLDGVT